MPTPRDLAWLVERAARTRDMDAFRDDVAAHLLARTGAASAALLVAEGADAGALSVSGTTDPELIRSRIEGREPVPAEAVVQSLHTRHCVCAVYLDGIPADGRDAAEEAVADALPLLDVMCALAVATDQASHDALTGLGNRRLLDDRLESIIEEGRRYGTTFSLAMIDANAFKWFNDTFGHAAGDLLLTKLAAILRSRTRRSDLAVRYGGDEFVLVLPHTAPDRAAELVRRVDAELRRILDAYDVGKVRLGVSFGVGAYPTDGTDAETLLAAADERLYEAKRSLGLPPVKPDD